MTKAAHHLVVQDDEGNLVPNSTVEIRNPVDDTLATVYADREGTSTVTNPVLLETGVGTVYLEGGAYEETAYGTVDGVSFERVREYVAVGTAQEYDVEQFLALVGTAVLQFRGNYDAGEIYQLYDVVLYERSSWVYIGDTPDSGNAPPSLPTTQNANWLLIARGSSGIEWDAIGAFAGRSTYDGNTAGFKYFSTDGDPSGSPAIGTGVIFVLESPGSPATWSDPIQIQGDAGPAGIMSCFTWQHSIVTADADPGSGYFRFNQSVLASVTEIYVDVAAYSGADVTAWLASFEAGDEVHFKSKEDESVEAHFRVTGAAVAKGGSPATYYALPVEYVTHVGSFEANAVYGMALHPIGPEGTVDTSDFLQPGVTNEITVGYTHADYGHGAKSGAVAITPNPSLGFMQDVTMNAGCQLTITPPSETGNCVLEIINGGLTSGLTYTGFTKVYTGDAYQTASGKIFRAYIEVMNGRSCILLKEVV